MPTRLPDLPAIPIAPEAVPGGDRSAKPALAEFLEALPDPDQTLPQYRGSHLHRVGPGGPGSLPESGDPSDADADADAEANVEESLPEDSHPMIGGGGLGGDLDDW